MQVTLSQDFFKYFGSKIQPPGFYISPTLFENGLTTNLSIEVTTKFHFLSIKTKKITCKTKNYINFA